MTLSGATLGNDVVSVVYGSASFADKNVGTGKAISVGGIGLSGADAGNYSVAATASATADVTRAPLVVGAVGIDRVYDTGTGATVRLVDNRLGNDVLNVAYGSAAFADKSAGDGKTVSVGGINVTGPDAGNYSFNTGTSTTANVARANLAVGIVAHDKVYDATTGATVTLSATPLGSDAVSASYARATFADKNAGYGKTVTVGGIGLTGADAGNYVVSVTGTATADIAPASLTVGAVGRDKLYDGTNRAAVTLVDNRFAGDQLTLAPTSVTFGDANAGKSKPVSVVGIHIAGGSDQGNYVLANTTAAATSDINAFSDAWTVLPVLAPPVVPPVATAPPSILDLTAPSGAGTTARTTMTDASAAGGSQAGGAGTQRGVTVVSGTASAGNPAVVVASADPQASITVALVRPSAERQPGLVSVSVPLELVSSGKGLGFALPETVVGATGGGVARVTLPDGSSLPDWLRYDARTRAFTFGAMPAGALPLELLVRIDNLRWTVVIEVLQGSTERPSPD